VCVRERERENHYVKVTKTQSDKYMYVCVEFCTCECVLMKSTNKHCRNIHKKVSFEQNENLNLALLQSGLITVLLHQFYVMKGPTALPTGNWH
jgi:hypothetical protein